jgi:methionyl-tRNA formyltransferase
VRVLLFGSGSPVATAALDALAREHDVAAVVMPPLRGWRMKLASHRFRAICRRRGIPIVPLDAGLLKTFNAELICVATFPLLLRAGVLAAVPRGAINLHPSLLPKHRGPDPLFWTFFEGDAQTGATVHWIDGVVDSGDIIEQEAIDVGPGESSLSVYRRIAHAGAAALVHAVTRIEAGTAVRIRQDDAEATVEPNPWTKGWTFDWSEWTAQRMGHFLRGMAPQSNDLLRGPKHGRLLRIGHHAHDREPGTIERGTSSLRVYCSDGWVDVAYDSLWQRGLRFLNRLY